MPAEAQQPQANPYDAIVPPDFSGDVFEDVRVALVANQTAADNAAAAASLLAKWTASNEQRRIQWNLDNPPPVPPQQDDDELPAPPPPPPAPPPPHIPAEAPGGEANNAFPAIDKSEPVPSRIEPTPPQSCITRLRDVKHVDLWYFTKEACADAALASRLDERTLSVEKDETSGTFMLKDVARPGKKPIADSNLDWEQMTSGKALFLKYVKIVEWPKDYIIAMISFFFQLENHSLRYEKPEIGKRALIRYQAVARQQWHDTLALVQAKKKAKLWDIADIDERLLAACVEVVEQAEASRLRIDLSAMQLQLNESLRDLRRIRERPPRSFEPSYTEGKRLRSPSLMEATQPPPAKRLTDSPRHFRDDTESTWICILCLSLDPHNKVKCVRTTLANGDKTWCHRDDRGRIVDPYGNVVCIEFNRKGCPSTDTRHHHECSGCGSTSHGAQSCHLVSKK
ncbi:hypothetical protein QCA50_003236 [Cerrena zonata]|uniref:Uncharacterized protein n=1 Tax=Cerrena zonata TaxID=2478898 RepID=A0AAW0GJU0_9APHY